MKLFLSVLDEKGADIFIVQPFGITSKTGYYYFCIDYWSHVTLL